MAKASRALLPLLSTAEAWHPSDLRVAGVKWYGEPKLASRCVVTSPRDNAFQ